MPDLVTILSGGIFTAAVAWAMGALALHGRPAPCEIRLGVGATIFSTIVYVLLLANAAHWGVFLGIGGAALAATRWASRRPLPEPAVCPLTGATRYAALAIGSIYGVFYFINALAPETIADGTTYHLGLAAEYVRTGGFPDRIAFYDMVPQGLEMLYVAAFSIGRHSAAKLVEFTFFVATVPLLFRVGRRLGLSDTACTVAATFYFCAPVVGVTGASSYNDAGQVFFALAAFYLLLTDRYPFAAGLLAGFCYAIKLPGLLAPAVALAFLLGRRNWKTAALFAAGAALTIAPWMARCLVLTGNPFAPLLNAWFPNPYFHIATEQGLARDLRSLGGVPWWRVPWELALGSRLTGIYGPLLLAVPLALAACRRRAGQLCCGLAVLLAIPWFTNTGARFLMLGVPFAALVLGMALDRLPRTAAWAAIALQAILCFPPVVAAFEPFYGFRLHEFPLAAALRIEPESAYLANHLDEYKVARMLARDTLPGARILALMPVATAYSDRDISVSWQSAEADHLVDTLRVAGFYRSDPFFDVSAEWPAQPLRAVRVRLPQSYAAEWCIHELGLFSAAGRVAANPHWTLAAWPNPSEATAALDLNLATRWRTWEPMRSGMYFEVTLDLAQRLSGATFQSHTPVFRVPMEFQGQAPDGRWQMLSTAPKVSQRPPEDLRRAATHAIHRAGYGFLLAPSGREGYGPLGRVIAGHETEWGLDRVGQAGDVSLYRIR